MRGLKNGLIIKIMKYKVGDKVRIKSLEWYNENKNAYMNVAHDDYSNSFVQLMADYCGMEANITEVEGSYYILDVDNGDWWWKDFMFEEPLVDDSNYEQLKEIAIELIRADVSPREVALWAKEIYKELKTK